MFLAKGVKEMVQEYVSNGHDIVIIAQGIAPCCRLCLFVGESRLQDACVNAR